MVFDMLEVRHALLQDFVCGDGFVPLRESGNLGCAMRGRTVGRRGSELQAESGNRTKGCVGRVVVDGRRW